MTPTTHPPDRTGLFWPIVAAIILMVGVVIGQNSASIVDAVAPPAGAEQDTATITVSPTPEQWENLRDCESRGHGGYTADTGNGYFGAYQFDQATWESVGGVGNPATNTPAEQDLRAHILWMERGSQPWPVCGALHLPRGPGNQILAELGTVGYGSAQVETTRGVVIITTTAADGTTTTTTTGTTTPTFIPATPTPTPAPQAPADALAEALFDNPGPLAIEHTG